MNQAHLKTAMTPFPHTIDARASVQEAASLMREHRIRHLPVKDDGVLVGIISERDVNVASFLEAADGDHPRVGELCTRDPFIVDINTPLPQVSATMAVRHLSAALVLKNEKLVGIFTGVDACRELARILGGTTSPAPEPEIA